MQRYFSTFPGSLPGVGLFLLRSVVGAGAAVQGAGYLTGASEPGVLMSLGAAVAVAGGLAVLAGFVTPVSGVVAGLATLALAVLSAPGASAAIDAPSAAILAADGAALALLGPGALSLDARLFGRREIIISHTSADTRS